jgi:general secretion pathway protein G
MAKKPLFPKVITVGLIVFLLLIVAAQRIAVSTRDPRGAATMRQIESYQLALELYVLDCGVTPMTTQGLSALVTNPGVVGWKGPYLDPPRIRSDAWGGPFRYRLNGTNMLVDSAGPDAKFDTVDDFRSQREK